MLKNPRFGVVLIVIGLVMISISFVWRLLIPQEVVWNAEQALEKSTAAAELHHMTHIAAHTEIDDTSEEEKAKIMRDLEAAKKRFNSSRGDLERARLVRDRTALGLRWAGIAFALVGIFQYQMVKPEK